MEALLQGIPGTRVFLDAVLISEPEDGYGKTVRRVLRSSVKMEFDCGRTSAFLVQGR